MNHSANNEDHTSKSVGDDEDELEDDFECASEDELVD
jgi:hypothetical protein